MFGSLDKLWTKSKSELRSLTGKDDSKTSVAVKAQASQRRRQTSDNGQLAGTTRSGAAMRQLPSGQNRSRQMQNREKKAGGGMSVLIEEDQEAQEEHVSMRSHQGSSRPDADSLIATTKKTVDPETRLNGKEAAPHSLLQNELARHQKEKKEFMTRIRELGQQISEQRQEIASIHSQSHATQLRLSGQNLVIAQLQKTIDEKEAKSRELLDNERKELQGDIEKYRKRTQNLAEQLQELKRVHQEDEAKKDVDIRARLQDIDRLGSELSSCSDRLEGTKGALSDAQRRIKTLTRANEKQQQELVAASLTSRDNKLETKQLVSHLRKENARLCEVNSQRMTQHHTQVQTLTAELRSEAAMRKKQEEATEKEQEQRIIAENRTAEHEKYFREEMQKANEFSQAKREWIQQDMEAKLQKATKDHLEQMNTATLELNKTREEVTQKTLDLNKLRNELTQEKRKTRDATEKYDRISQQMEYTQQRCAEMYDEDTEDDEEQEDKRETEGQRSEGYWEWIASEMQPNVE